MMLEAMIPSLHHLIIDFNHNGGYAWTLMALVVILPVVLGGDDDLP